MRKIFRRGLRRLSLRMLKATSDGKSKSTKSTSKSSTNSENLSPEKLKEMIASGASGVKKIFGKGAEPNKTDDSIYNSNIDDLVDTIVRAKEIDGFVSRVVSNFKQKSLKTGFKFDSKESKNIEAFEDHFENLMIQSGYTSESFFEEMFRNFISFGNVYIHKTLDLMTKQVIKLTILPSKGWTPQDSHGTFVIKWQFEIGDTTTTYTNKNITHIVFERETHHVMGTPLTANALQDATLLREVESECVQDYFDSLEKKSIFFVGTKDKPARQEELDETADKINNTSENEDLVLSRHVEMDLIQPTFNEKGIAVLEKMKSRVLAALRSSGTGVGESGGAGRQDANELGDQEDSVVEDLQSSLANELNRTLIRELCLDLFGKVDSKSQVKLMFNETFTKKERREKHEIFKYLSNVTTLDETRKELGNRIKPKEKNLYGNMFGNGMSQEGAKSVTNPSNQHGEKGNSKPSVKN